MKSFTSIVGWLLLVALVAVPSVIFYNWLSARKTTDAEAMPQPGAPPPAALFSGADRPAGPAAEAPQQGQGGGWTHPPASRQPPAPQARPAQAHQPQAPAQQAPPAPPPDQASPSASAPPPQMPTQQPPGQPPQQQPPAQSGVSLSTQPKTVSYFAPKADRDPTMSPDDYQKIRDAEEQLKEAERLERERIARDAKMRGPERQISLQGIVGNQAIINGEMYTVGQAVKGARIIRIGADYIICEWNDKGTRKTFKKKMQ